MTTTNENENWTNQSSQTAEPRSTVVPGELADLPTRFFAAAIDGVVVGAVTSAISFPIVFSLALPWFLSPLVFSAIAFGVFAAANFKLLENEGQTIGKKLMRLRIVKADGSRPELQELLTKRYALVWLVSAIPFIGFLLALGNLLLGLRDSRLAGHDEIAGTKVVNA